MLSESNQQQEFWGLFLRALMDRGGTTEHLNILFQEARSKHHGVLDQIAKMVVGPIWNLVENPVTLNLKQEDFEVKPSEFIKSYPKKILHPSAHFSESHPDFSRPCRYRLEHNRYSRLSKTIPHMFSAHSGNLLEHAGWRELVAYTSHLTLLDLSFSNIIAAGSCKQGFDGLFPVAQDNLSGGISIFWTDSDKAFGLENFFLVRDYY